MKRFWILPVVVCLLTAAAYSQAPVDFSGEWILDKSKSTLPDRMKNIEGMTVKIEQKEKKIKINTETEFPNSKPTVGGGNGSPAIINLNGSKMANSRTYNLDGKEHSFDETGPMGGSAKVKTNAKFNGPILELSTAQSTSTPMGDLTITTWDNLELLPDGTLKMKRQIQTNHGNQSAELFFTKKLKKR